MCGRFIGFDEDNETIGDIYKKAGELYPDTPIKRGEVFPTDVVPVLTGPDLVPVPMRWGYPMRASKGVMFNARSETVTEKYSFRDGFTRRRCVVPTCGYYEWDSRKQKFRFNLPDDPTLCLGGFFDAFADGYRFIILTTEPNESVREVHNRMPLILPRSSLSDWTGSFSYAVGHLSDSMPELTHTPA